MNRHCLNFEILISTKRAHNGKKSNQKRPQLYSPTASASLFAQSIGGVCSASGHGAIGGDGVTRGDEPAEPGARAAQKPLGNHSSRRRRKAYCITASVRDKYVPPRKIKRLPMKTSLYARYHTHARVCCPNTVQLPSTGHVRLHVQLLDVGAK